VSIAADSWVDAGERIVGGIDAWADVVSATSRAIQLSAIESFATHGFHGTTLRHIAAGSGLSTAALYVHFGSKEDLLFAISRRGHRAALDLVEQAAGLSLGPAATMRALIYAFSRWHAEQRTIARVVQYERGALAPEHRDEIAALRRRTEQVVREVVERGVAEGAFAVPEIRGAVAAVLSLGIDLARWYSPDGPYTPDGIGRLYADLGMRMLGAG
jgi:AcrR family transcriptional regulator